MNSFNELIGRLKLDGVPFKTLGDVGTFVRGNGLQKKDLTDEGVPAVHYGQIHTHYGVWATETKSFTSKGLAAKLRHAKPGDLLIATTSEDDHAVAKATAWLGESDVVLSGDAYIYSHTLEPKYVAYFFQSEQFESQKRRYVSGTKVRRVSGASLAKVRIPVPPREVQREIARILDQFVQLEAELEAELEARRRQYGYYRNSMVTKSRFRLSDWVPLENVASIRAGNRPESISHVGDIPYINAGNEPSGFTESANTHGGAVTIPSRGQGSAGHVGFQNAEFWCGPLCYRVVSSNPEVLDKFLYYFLKNIQEEIVALRKVGSIPAVNKSDLGKVLVPVVAIDEQLRTVAALDRFDALVNDSGVGLPAELAARREQYKYYRDKLLTFEESTA
ncbi:restriction endonuclease subunit S [Rhodococcoides fascians A25f]|uniref:restriction endonuclease subunit S n=1 Tax=Rhodococcoides fascians TaxID=1828 RepID=UPI00056639D8|nr:restriction endonuclease subunit S [Rhodococcus fascians]QII05550.1 restriction endonuclease subunit S [Rhodococcus fascians A25f]